MPSTTRTNTIASSGRSSKSSTGRPKMNGRPKHRSSVTKVNELLRISDARLTICDVKLMTCEANEINYSDGTVCSEIVLKSEIDMNAS